MYNFKRLAQLNITNSSDEIKAELMEAAESDLPIHLNSRNLARGA